ncbi:MAG: hypothetical protein N2248_03065 [candidate division WOR-3 bacterium]|uniref:Uncharacterized protein n=1 Tax=candidate division WOR-3 bacterium TaxID=2052148 RepID=A0A7C1SMN3_UNCW3|nr:hypothetical protein [candidate division WOR-3 bacterium]
MSSTHENIFLRLQRIDRRWIYLVLWLVIMVPLIFPFRIQPRASTPVAQLFNYIDTMPENKALVISVDFTPDTRAELQPMVIALLRHAFTIKRRVGILAMQVYGLGLAEEAIQQVTNEFNSRAQTHEDSVIYGEDFVFWGWTTPLLTVMLGMGERITRVFPVDYYGNPTESLPIMRDLKNYDDVGILVSIAASAMPRSWINFAQVQFGVNLSCGITAVSAADFYPYVNSGQFIGMLAGMKGAAEYEQLVEKRMKNKGMDWGLRNTGTEAMSSQTAAHLAIMVFIVVGNIAYFASRRRKK